MKRTFLLTFALAALLSATAYADIIGPGEMLARSGALPAVLVIAAAVVTALILRRKKWGVGKWPKSVSPPCP